ncbi:MAG: type II toxin-antitoxin system RelE/ParE family toxin [Actinomycetota bacterium]|nr:type II toxin-antitoxin system RelE/ParE family toxin [Actinomycetota bacterium]
MAGQRWEVEFHPLCEVWADGLDAGDAEALLAAIRILLDEGPTLGRPLVDTVKGSRHANMKELRPGSTGRTEIRVLFAFDRRRNAILLVGGDKSDDWIGWYAVNVPLADRRFEEHQLQLRADTQPGKRRKGRNR